jgi:hypothetical protein
MPRRFDKLEIEPAQIGAMHAAYEKACTSLGLSPVPDRINEILVTKIVELSQTERATDSARRCWPTITPTGTRLDSAGAVRRGGAPDGGSGERVGGHRRLRYPSNVDTVALVNLSGSDSPVRTSSTILTATSSTTGVAPVSSNRAQACLNARFIASLRCLSSSA